MDRQQTARHAMGITLDRQRDISSKKDVVWKAVCNKTKRKTKNEMAG